MSRTLPEATRKALKSELRKRGLLPSNLPITKELLLGLAEKHGIDLATLDQPPASAGVNVLASDETLDAEDLAAWQDENDNAEWTAHNIEVEASYDAPASTVAPVATARALDSVATIMGKLTTGDVVGFKDSLDKLFEAASKPVEIEKIVTLEKIVTVEKVIDRVVSPVTHKGHIPQVVRHEPANVLLDTSDAGKIPLAVWDAPDSPAIDLDYVWPVTTGLVLSQLSRGRNVFLSGPRGAGKTSFAEQLAARQRRPLVRVQCHEQTDAATLIGMTVPDKNGGTRWQDGILSAAIRRPGTIVLIDEPSIARPGALFAFQSVLDSTRALVVEETGERIPAADGVTFIMADNTAGHGDERGLYAGTRQINSATLDRCGVMVVFTWLPPAKEAKAIAARAKCTLPLADALVAFATLTRDAALQGKLTAGLGPRRLIAWAELVMDGYANEASYDACVHDMAAPEDREALRQLWKANISITTLKNLAKGTN